MAGGLWQSTTLCQYGSGILSPGKCIHSELELDGYDRAHYASMAQEFFLQVSLYTAS